MYMPVLDTFSGILRTKGLGFFIDLCVLFCTNIAYLCYEQMAILPNNLILFIMFIDKNMLDLVTNQFVDMSLRMREINARRVGENEIRLNFQSTNLGLLEKLSSTERSFVMHLIIQEWLRLIKDCRIEHTIFIEDEKETYMLEITY